MSLAEVIQMNIFVQLPPKSNIMELMVGITLEDSAGG